MACLDEVNSIMWKFCSLWKSGWDANLSLETHAGQACVSLRVGLGFYEERQIQPKIIPSKKKLSPSRNRRRERRAAAAAEKLVNKERDKVADIICEETEEVVKNGCDIKEESAGMDVITENLYQQDTKVAGEAQNVEALYLECKDEDADLYVYTYWDTRKASDLNEAIGYITGALTKSLEFHNVGVEDRSFSICMQRKMEDNEIEVYVKLKKNARLVDTSARRIQTAYKADDPIYISLKRVMR